MKRLAVLLASLLTFVLGVRPVWAHAAPHSVVLLDLRADDARAELRLPVAELEAALGRPLLAEQAAVVEREGAAIGALVLQGLHAESLAGTAWSVSLGDLGYDVEDHVPVVVVTATLAPPQSLTGNALPPFRLLDRIISAKVPNHRSWIGVRSDFARGFVSGTPTLVGVADQRHEAVLVDRGSTAATDVGALRGFRAVFSLGVRHIAEGTDHLLFLLVLLLPAPLLVTRTARGRRRWSGASNARASLLQLLRVVSAFTAGHSLTLLGGTVGWLRLPGAQVETLIAVSVVVSAVHALRPLFPGREAWIAGAFGLVHGLAFASALGQLHLDGRHLVLALLGFNLGLEAMQLMIVAATFPWLLLLARTRFYGVVRMGGALVAGVAAVGWIGQRAFGASNPLDPLVSALVTRWAVLLTVLVVGAVMATIGRFTRRQCALALGSLALSCAPAQAGTTAAAPPSPRAVELANASAGSPVSTCSTCPGSPVVHAVYSSGRPAGSRGRRVEVVVDAEGHGPRGMPHHLGAHLGGHGPPPAAC